ncbi:MAG: rRNA maturation RNase YbeY [Deltaproteobacteria bacterium RBG_13_58_19]|nr:MAG: rRNA maturation RNase YbeY [Deltaproteobacteria bacterium RBG_13_58_19]
MKIWINNRQRKITVRLERVRRRAGKILNALGWGKAELSLTLVSDRSMARLNRETFGRRGPTNVIAFPLHSPDDPQGPPPLLGEVVISLETTARQAQESGWTFVDLFDFFLIHGILHLLDYDHDTPEKAQAMDAKTWELMGVLRGGGG